MISLCRWLISVHATLRTIIRMPTGLTQITVECSVGIPKRASCTNYLWNKENMARDTNLVFCNYPGWPTQRAMPIYMQIVFANVKMKCLIGIFDGMIRYVVPPLKPVLSKSTGWRSEICLARDPAVIASWCRGGTHYPSYTCVNQEYGKFLHFWWTTYQIFHIYE